MCAHHLQPVDFNTEASSFTKAASWVQEAIEAAHRQGDLFPIDSFESERDVICQL
jgi:hypothetical protein